MAALGDLQYRHPTVAPILHAPDQPLRFAATLSPTGLNHLYAFDLSLSLLLLLLQLEPEMAAVEVERDLWEQQARQRLVGWGRTSVWAS